MAVKLEQIISETAKACGVTVEQILGSDRTPDVLTARQLALFVVRKNTTFSLPQIATAFAKTHATVIHAVRQMEQRLGEEPELRDRYKRLLATILPMIASDQPEKISELVHFYRGRGPVNVRVFGDPKEINLTMHLDGDTITIVVTANKGNDTSCWSWMIDGELRK